MPVDIAVQAPCESTVGCQLSLACRDQVCGPCSADSDCLANEQCVLDHCLLTDQARCASRRDCEPGELCILRRTGSNAFTDPRGNKFLESMCTNEGRGPSVEQRRTEIDVPEPISGPAHPLPDSDIDELGRVFRNGIGKDLRE